MPLADANGPRWIRQQKLAVENAIEACAPCVIS